MGPFVRSRQVRLGVLACLLSFLMSSQAEPAPKVEYLTNSIGMKLALVPAAKFLMGSPASEKERANDEFQHEAQLTRAFFIGVYEVTQAEYAKVMGVNPSWFSATGGGKGRVKDRDTGTYPVEDVTWSQAVEFCNRLSQLPSEKEKGRVYRLPTEAEWEFACRAGTSTVFHGGNGIDSYQANLNGLSPYDGRPSPYLRNTCPAGEYAPNRLGLFDMHGNVQEWCADWYAAGYSKDSPKADPQGPKDGSERVVRGGCWMNSGKACRSAQRNKLAPGKSTYGIGFRVALEGTR